LFSYETIGKEILHLIIHLIIRGTTPYAGSTSDPGRAETDTSKNRRITVQKLTKVLAAYSLAPSAKTALVQKEGLLACLVQVIDFSAFYKSKQEETLNGSNTTEAAQFNAVATITNLALDDRNRTTMLVEPSLVLNISIVANSANSEMMRQCAALAIMNLSHGNEDQAHAMTEQNFLLDTLVKLMDDENALTRRNAAVALYNLASSEDNSDLIARYGNRVIIDIMAEIIVSDDALFWEQGSKARAAEAIFNLACESDKETFHQIANHHSLASSLAQVISVGNSPSSVLLYCVGTLRRIAEIISFPTSMLDIILTALVESSGWRETDDIAEAFDIQASIWEHRKIMLDHPGVLDALCFMGMEESESCAVLRSHALSAIEKLSAEEETRYIMVENASVMLTLTKASYCKPEGPLDHFTVTKVKAALKNLVAIL